MVLIKASHLILSVTSTGSAIMRNCLFGTGMKLMKVGFTAVLIDFLIGAGICWPIAQQRCARSPGSGQQMPLSVVFRSNKFGLPTRFDNSRNGSTCQTLSLLCGICGRKSKTPDEITKKVEDLSSTFGPIDTQSLSSKFSSRIIGNPISAEHERNR